MRHSFSAALLGDCIWCGFNPGAVATSQAEFNELMESECEPISEDVRFALTDAGETKAGYTFKCGCWLSDEEFIPRRGGCDRAGHTPNDTRLALNTAIEAVI